MKKILIAAALLIGFKNVSAQADPTATAAKSIETAPSFKIIKAPDSTAFSSTELKKDKPFVLMFFSPDCEHCQKETKELLAYKQELKGLQIIMVSPLSFDLIKTFYQDYGLASMPDVVVGQDANYALGSRYQLRTYPSIFVYDAKGKLAKAFVGNAGVPAILDAVK